MSVVGTLWVTLRGDVRPFQSAMTTAGKSIQKTRQGMEQLRHTASSLRMVMLGIGSAIAARRLFGSTLQEVADFQYQIGRAGILSKATAEELQQLEKRARELGATTVYTANQVAEGMSSLALAGFNAREILSAIRPVLDSAAAGELDLARTARITANMLRSFRLDASEAGRVVDTLTMAFTSSQTTLEELGDSLKYVAPVAADLGRSLEETVAVTSTLADVGLQGSIAGTAVRAVLTHLLRLSPPVRKALRELGIAVKDINPQVHTLAEIFRRFAEAGMTSKEAVQMFLQRGGPAASSLAGRVDELAEAFDRLMKSSGRASEVSVRQMDNLVGAYRRLTSALSELKLHFAYDLGKGKLIQGLRDMTETAAKVVGEISGMNEKMGIEVTPTVKSLANAVKLATAAMLAFTASILMQAVRAGTVFITTTLRMAKAFGPLQRALNLLLRVPLLRVFVLMSLGPLRALYKILVLLSGLFYILQDRIVTVAGHTFRLSTAFRVAYERLKVLWRGVRETAKELTESYTKASAGWVQNWLASIGGLRGLLTILGETARKTLLTFTGGIDRLVNSLMKAVVVTGSMVTRLVIYVERGWLELKKIFLKVQSFFVALPDALMRSFSEAIRKAPLTAKAFLHVLQIFSYVVSKVIQKVTGLDKILAKLEERRQKRLDVLRSTLASLVKQFDEMEKVKAPVEEMEKLEKKIAQIRSSITVLKEAPLALFDVERLQEIAGIEAEILGLKEAQAAEIERISKILADPKPYTDIQRNTRIVLDFLGQIPAFFEGVLAEAELRTRFGGLTDALTQAWLSAVKDAGTRFSALFPNLLLGKLGLEAFLEAFIKRPGLTKLESWIKELQARLQQAKPDLEAFNLVMQDLLSEAAALEAPLDTLGRDFLQVAERARLTTKDLNSLLDEFLKLARQAYVVDPATLEPVEDMVQYFKELQAVFLKVAELRAFRQLREDAEEVAREFSRTLEYTERIADLEKMREAFPGVVSRGIYEAAVADALEKQYDRLSALLRLTRRWSDGMQAAMLDYSRAVTNAAQNMYDAFNNAFSRLEDVLADFIVTAKFNFRSLIESIQRDITRLIIRQQITGPLAQLFSPTALGVPAGGTNWLMSGLERLRTLLPLPGRQMGGPVERARPYLVGERGPEVFVPEMSGMILPQARGPGHKTVEIRSLNIILPERVKDVEGFRRHLPVMERRLIDRLAEAL